MNALFENNTFPLCDNQDDSLKQNLELIIYERRKNVLLVDMKNIKEYLEQTFFKYTDRFKIVYIDLILEDRRNDFIEQTSYCAKKLFPENIIVQFLFEKYYTLKSDHYILKDEIFYSIFKELSKDSHLVLVVDNFNLSADHIIDTDYHRLKKLYCDECKGKISFILVVENKNLSILKKTYRRRVFFDTFDNTDNSLYQSLSHKKIIYETKMRRHEVYISYAWGGESEIIVTEICQQLQNNKVKYYIDKKDIAYKDSIREFEERLGAGDYVILVVSDKFLKSKDCMYEFLQIKNAGNIYERIFPIVLEDAKIYDPNDRIYYIKYWEEKVKELDENIKTISPAYLSGLRDDIDNYTEYRKIIPEITALLSRMNTLSPQVHRNNNYSELIKAIERQHEKDSTSISERGNFSADNTITSELKHRRVNQYGENSIYIENNNGDIIIN
ncbi:toll/interleukin-1 receptor domain-containing protein [Macellibacteroides fermentans]|uniref:TIR domain-containing protein n=1 Tax=Parabacteroides chartae TaxID=1037355 RepID=A0A1T5C8M7_9BACT|nr:toll/interleukin-1 receptor domain-containing protein [Parabacteroides chartae]SKB55932.1 TIR domain-containing protein [Parabacteroides chartae]